MSCDVLFNLTNTHLQFRIYVYIIIVYLDKDKITGTHISLWSLSHTIDIRLNIKRSTILIYS